MKLKVAALATMCFAMGAVLGGQAWQMVLHPRKAVAPTAEELECSTRTECGNTLDVRVGTQPPLGPQERLSASPLSHRLTGSWKHDIEVSRDLGAQGRPPFGAHLQLVREEGVLSNHLVRGRHPAPAFFAGYLLAENGQRKYVTVAVDRGLSYLTLHSPHEPGVISDPDGFEVSMALGFSSSQDLLFIREWTGSGPGGSYAFRRTE